VSVLGDDAGVAVEVVVVDGEHGDGLDPVERGRDPALPRDVGGPREHERVHDAGDRAAPRRERVHELPEAARAGGVEGRHVGVEGARVGAPDVPGLHAVGEGEELEAPIVFDGVVVGAAVGGGGLGREHAPVRDLGGGEGDERVGRGHVQPPGEAESRGDVALEREGEHEEVAPRRRHLRLSQSH